MFLKTLGVITLGILAASGGTLALAKTAENPVRNLTPIVQEQNDVQEPTYTGSIIIDTTRYKGVSEQDEISALSGLAKITADQAKQAAEAKVSGIASSVELGDENGTLVYEVKIGNQEVKVDAGDGSILKVENDDNEKESIESEDSEESVEDGDFEKDGIDHQFEGEEEHND